MILVFYRWHMFFHLEVRIPFFLDDVAKVMSFLNCTQFLHHFCYLNDTKSRYALMGLPDWTGMFRAYVWLEGCVSTRRVVRTSPGLFFPTRRVVNFSPGLVWAMLRPARGVTALCIRRRWMVGTRWGCVWNLVRSSFHSLSIYVIYSLTNHSPVHRVLVCCWYSWVYGVKVRSFKPSHHPVPPCFCGFRCEYLKIQAFTPETADIERKTYSVWTGEYFFGEKFA